MFGAAAVRALAEGQNGVMVALNPPRIDYVPLKQAVAKMKTVPLEFERHRHGAGAGDLIRRLTGC